MATVGAAPGLRDLLIALPFFPARGSGADDPQMITPFRVNNNQQSPGVRASQNDKPLLDGGMLRVRNHQRARIAKHRGGLLERDPVFSGVARRLAGIPFKVERHERRL